MPELRRLLAEVRANRIYPTAYRAVRRMHRRVMDGELFSAGSSTPAEIEVVAGERRDEFWARLRERLAERAVPYTSGGSDQEWRPRLHLREQDAGALFEILTELAGSARPADSAPGVRWLLYQQGQQPHQPIEGIGRDYHRRRFTKLDLWVLERPSVAAPARRPEGLFTVIEIDFWGSPERSFRAEPYAVAPRYNAVATSMRWRELNQLLGVDDPATRAGDLAEVDQLPDLDARDFPIDLVYTWVDDQDPNWQAIKNEHLPDGSKITVGEGRADHAERFRNRDELKYSLRSIEMFAPFVRNIYLVTMDQTPAWLNTDHPQLTVVSHSDIYADPQALPTFNSSSIETQLHHINGLAEQFIYFNDDVFLGRPCSWRDFFWANGAAKYFPATHTVSANLIDDHAEEYLVADRNAIRLLEAEFGRSAHAGMMHTPHPSRRSVLQELEKKYPDQFADCASSRFRSRQDLRPIAFFGHHYGFATGRAMPAEISNRYLALWKPQIAAQLANVLRTRKYKTFCINDVGVTDDREDEVNRQVGSFLDAYFPLPSRFERAG
ncbi:stealth family protein [Microlunatus speluncae]|uniref:stealth family protein n=1 Tax=Microlunatus speluncae TaxID=2594267 RepID=UPI0013757A91|nr:stealth family protein [Microlunatus speluncae]